MIHSVKWYFARPGNGDPVLTCTDDECGHSAPSSKWAETAVYCEVCGEHFAAVCPKCDEVYDLTFKDKELLGGRKE